MRDVQWLFIDGRKERTLSGGERASIS